MESIPDISALSILLVLRGAIPGIHGGELCGAKWPNKKDGDARRRCIAYANVKEPLRRRCGLWAKAQRAHLHRHRARMVGTPLRGFAHPTASSHASTFSRHDVSEF
jgi:hypothetical protein